MSNNAGSPAIEDITDILSGQRADPRFAANPEYAGHEKVIFAQDPSIGFKAFIAVHNTRRGPGLGGCRYRSDYAGDDEAVTDVLRLSKGMTYKNAMAGLDLGGGKAVIFGPAGQDKPTSVMMSALGRAVQSLNGLYVTAEDMNTTERDMETVMAETSYVCGIPLAKTPAAARFPAGFDPASLPGANPSPYTAYGTLEGIRAAVRHRLGRDDLKGVRAAVKGAAGAVGSDLCRMLHERGAKLTVSDRDGHGPSQDRLAALAKRYGAAVTASAEIMAADADVFAPCAGGADLDDRTIPLLKAKAVAGCANNVLAAPRHAAMLRERNILYAPDYVINAGGVICVGEQYLWQAHPDRYPVPTHQGILNRVSRIHAVLLEVFARADQEGRDTASVADAISEERFAARAHVPEAA